MDSKKNIGKDFKEKINQEWYENAAESHIEAWKERYFRKSKKDILFDLNVNHDLSGEIENAEETLGRELTSEEYDFLENKFNKTVANVYYK